jgi:hypothetical protein
MVLKDELEEHEDEFHKTVDCVNCGQGFEKSKLTDHHNSCMKRLQICQYCNQQFGYDIFFDHQDGCGARTQECEFCAKTFTLRDLQEHEIICPTIMADQAAEKRIREESSKFEVDRKRSDALRRADEDRARQQKSEEEYLAKKRRERAEIDRRARELESMESDLRKKELNSQKEFEKTLGKKDYNTFAKNNRFGDSDQNSNLVEPKDSTGSGAGRLRKVGDLKKDKESSKSNLADAGRRYLTNNVSVRKFL